MSEIDAEIDRLEARLAYAERRIAEATRIEPDIERWERFWLDLLADYELIHRRLADSPLLRGGA
jgi:hypothetical protein